MRRKSSFIVMTSEELGQFGSQVEFVCTECGTRQFLFVSPPQVDGDGWFPHRCIMNTEFLVCDGKMIEVKGTWKLLKEGK